MCCTDIRKILMFVCDINGNLMIFEEISEIPRNSLKRESKYKKNQIKTNPDDF